MLCLQTRVYKSINFDLVRNIIFQNVLFFTIPCYVIIHRCSVPCFERTVTAFQLFYPMFFTHLWINYSRTFSRIMAVLAHECDRIVDDFTFWLPHIALLLRNFLVIFLGALSLHLNHLIGSGVANYNWQFGTLPFGLFGSNLDTMGLETYPRTYSGHFWHMSLFDDFRAVWVFSKNGCSQKIKVFSMKEWSLRGFAIQFSVQGFLG